MSFKTGTLSRLHCANCNDETLHRGFKCTRDGCGTTHPLARVVDKPSWNGRAGGGGNTIQPANYLPKGERS